MLKKSLSQNLLKDKNILNKMVRLAGIGEDDTVAEIGAGHGDLTRALIPRAHFVYAIELDERFRQYLEPLERQFSNIKTVYMNVLEIPFKNLAAGAGLTVMGNIPYHITGEILFKILRERETVDRAFLTMQKEVAQRLVSKPKTRVYGSLSVVFQLHGDVKLLLSLKPSLFVPPPKVESAFISIIFKEKGPVDDGLLRFIRNCFRYKRKYLRHTLEEEYGRERVKGLYTAMGFGPGVRAEELEPAVFERMYRYLHEG